MRRISTCIVRGVYVVATLVAIDACNESTPTKPTGDTSHPTTHTVASAPLNVMAVPGNALAVVSWQPPASDGGSAVVSYTVTSSPGASTATVNAPTTTATIAGLTNGTAYTFTVVATNGVGASSPSAPSSAVTPIAPVPSSSGRWISGYYVSYQRVALPPASIPYTLMTHVIFGAIEATATGGVDTSFFIGNTDGPQLARTVAAGAHAAGRKAILMLGGSGFRTNILASTTDTYRAAFVANLLAVMDKFGYDGLDIDWEPIIASDQPQIITFLSALRAARPGIIITFPVGWGTTTFGVNAWYAQLAGLVDQMNMMSYDMAYAWPGWVSWHFAALEGDAPNHPSSIAASATAYLNAGVPAGKIGIGIGFYGSCWRGVTGPTQTIGSGVTFGNSDNAMSYANIMSSYYTANAWHWDSTAHQSYLSYATGYGPQSCNFISYEDARSITDKGAYVVNQGLGGAIVWTVSQGHLGSAPAGQQDPLLSAAWSAIRP